MTLLPIRASLALGFLLGAFAPSLAATPVLKGADLFSLSRASDPQFSPDGTALAYVRIANDIMADRGLPSIWLADPRTGAQSPLTGPGVEASHPRWSPDGTRIAFLHPEPDGGADLEVIWVATGRTAQIARLAATPRDVAWSPNGALLAYTLAPPAEATAPPTALEAPKGSHWAPPLRSISRIAYRADGVGYVSSGYSHIYLVSADGGPPRQLTDGAADDEGPLRWSPDGSSLIFTGRRDAQFEREPFHSAVWRVAVADGALTRLTTGVGPYGDAALSPDGRLMAYTGYEDHKRSYENRKLFVADADGGHVRALQANLDRGLTDPVWAADGRSVYAKIEDHGSVNVVQITLTGEMHVVAEGLAGGGLDLPYTGGEFALSPTGEVAFTQGGPDHPPELAVVRRGEIRRVTHLNDALLGARELGVLHPLKVRSKADGAAVDAWYITPPGAAPGTARPMILEIHGGPFANYGPVFATDDQLYAAAGYVVLYVNPRGSTAYGEAFANGIDKAYPGLDYDDLMSAVDALVDAGVADPKALYVTGGSGGGVLTAWIVGKTNRFRAAVSQKPVINWSSEVLTTDLYPWMAAYWFGKPPWEDAAEYWRRSPLSLVGNVATPTLVIVGDRDLRTPDSEAEQLFDALQLRGVPTGLVLVPGAFHDMAARPSHAAAKAETVLAWFARFGGPAGAAPTPLAKN